MGKLIKNSGKKLLRYGNFTNSITKSYETDYNGKRTSYVTQNFLGKTYRLFEVFGNDSISRTSNIYYGCMNGIKYNDKYNLKDNSIKGYWGSGTLNRTSNCLIKEENVFPYNSLNSSSVIINIPSTCTNSLVISNGVAINTTQIYIFVTLNSELLGDNIYGHHNSGVVDWPSEFYPYYDMGTDYELYYNFNYNNDYNKNLRISTYVPTKYNYYTNVFIYIPNIFNITCDIWYNPGSMNGHDVHENDEFSYTELYYDEGDLSSSGVGYSFYVDGNEGKAHEYEWCGEAEITFTNVS